ncbi:putative ubiquitin c-terminal [Phaeomoniella chlamydospora]|uniref:Putative ubiquitin c-terminal n=1 Tax=Phaeomoniella chlamydospora TaxID=158046 RepID=A0A0G2FY24_PHACM|nr:putative ubiquitin c-terminal [Phaeomoniella chlamydospora]
MHIKDIVASARPEIDRGSSLKIQLEKAGSYIGAAKRAVEFRRPDLAYKDYIRGAEIALNYIPSHRDLGLYDHRNGWDQEYKALLKQVKNMDGMMDQIRQMIEEDNARSGIQPNSESRPSSRGSSVNGHHQSLLNGPDMPSVPSTAPGSNVTSDRLHLEGHMKSRPIPGPKPDNLYAIASRENRDDLSLRLARLRTPSSGPGAAPVGIPVPEDYIAHRSPPNQTVSTSRMSINGQVKPNGPRDMPPPYAPSVPPKLPISTTMPSLPRAPDPTYSPSSAPVSSAITSSRRSNEHTRPPIEKRPTYYNQPNPPGVPLQLQRTRDENPYRPRTPNGVNSTIVSKSSSSEIPHTTSISAETLVGYIRKYNVLLVDIRPREVFDSGHIFSKSIMCIEPLTLKEGVSAEDLEERLVVSPEQEQELFSKRNEFDLVVYYDQNTSSTRFLIGPPTSSKTPELRAIYDTLYEFNEYKPLRDGRPPALLSGGIDAWVDLMGPNSLSTSQTAALMGSIKSRKSMLGPGGRPMGRQRMASANSSLEVRRRRLREHKPLDLEEERAWAQKAQAEEVQTSEYAQVGSDGEADGTVEEEPASPSFVADYESFLRKFPALQNEPQSMVAPLRAPPSQVQFDRPQMPEVPSRPPPAVPRVSYSGLHDIQPPQAPLARQASANRPALHPTYSTSRRLRLPRTGLVNFGVTCYMNSTLQCLSATIPLSQFFLEDRYKQFLQKNWKGSSGIMPGLYTNVVRSLWNGDVEAIKPTTFRTFCGRMNREWAIDRQQDAKEFYDFLVDCLHEDLNINWNRTVLKPLTPAEELQRERTQVSVASGYEWQRFQHRDYSFISSLFAGQHASRLRCTTCQNTSTTYEAFYSISVEIPHQAGSGADIYSCLRSYTQEEMLSGEEVWKCPHCKCEREATKQIILTRMPQFLVIHFKRFSASKTESARKIHTPIEFPLHNLSMDPFMIQHPPPPTPAQDQMKETVAPDQATTPPYSYDCYGVLRHLGNTLSSGHYISLVKDQGRNCWRKYDDERTVDFDPMRLHGRDRLQNGEAYILFYQRAAPH